MRIKRMSFLFIAILIMAFSVPVTPAFSQQITQADTPSSTPDPAADTPDLAVPLASSCASSSPSSGSYTVTVCFTTPGSGSTVTGPVTVTATVSVTGSNPGVQRTIFYINSAYLLTDFLTPFSFSLPSMKWQDGTYTLGVVALMKDGYTTTNQPTISLVFSNGNAQPPVNHNTFTPKWTTPPPGSPFIVTAGGDGADGMVPAGNVNNLMTSINPNLFLYLGDVYYSGSIADFYNWYGIGGTYFNKFYSITDPTIGNHEYTNSVNGVGYFDYWNNIPNYYSFNAGGWHFVSLNSNGSKVGGLGTTSPEYLWLAQDLAANSNLCTIAYYHHPLFNIGPEGPATGMSNIWALMAQDGVSLVLNGHDHDYQRWVPLNGSGNPSATGTTEIIAGTAGHGIQAISKTDSRVAFSEDVSPTAYGVLKLALSSTGASFSYINTSGTVLDSGVIPCNKVGGDTQAPSVPGGLTATAVSNTQVNLAWQASTDNVGVTGYTIYRNNVVLTTVSGTTLNFADTTAQPSTTYSYTVDAFDAAGNHSAKSAPTNVTTPGPDTQAPSVPAGLTATAVSNTQVNLAWQASTDNVGVTGYTIYRNSVVLTTVSGTTLNYADTTAQPSTTYSYTVDAFDAAGNHSAQSAPAIVTTPGPDTQAPSVPAGLTATAVSSTKVNLAWQASTDNIAVAGYTIYRNGVVLTTVSGSVLTYSDTTVSPSTTYSYTVDAFDAAGNHSAQSTPASVTTPGPDTQAPSIPAGLTATAASPTQVNLAWQASTDNIGVSGYTIYRNSAVLTTVSGTSVSYADTSAQPSTTYSYTVDAFDAAGNHSAQSSPASVTTPALPTSFTFGVGADTYVNSGSPTTNYGTSTVWRVDGSPIENGYLKFTVTGLNGNPILHAYLHVYANSSSSSGISAMKVTDNTWGETTLTYNTAPALGALLASSGSFPSATWLTFDVTSYITAEGTYSFGMLTPGATNVSLAAKESGVNVAYLVVTIP